jgi:predicted nucleotidyltransferase
MLTLSLNETIVVLLLHMLYKYHINQTTLKILSLFRSNYKTSLYLREIAREIQVDAKAVSLQLNRLEKTNILTSIQKGKNKEYSLNLGNYLTLYYIVLAEDFVTIEYLDRNFEVKKLVSETADKLGKIAMLFGSFAKGNMTQESDIDILIIDDKKPNLSVFKEVGSLLSREISIKCMSEEQFSNGLANKDPLTLEVAVNHIILKGIDNVCNMLWRYYAK